jgi:hypothetical protein
MELNNVTAQQAIGRSASHNETVYMSYRESLNEDLLVECEDNNRTGTFVEYWGTTDDGNEWRVLLRLSVDE